MSGWEEIDGGRGELCEACEQTRESFSPYLDGALDGRTMAQLAAHLRECRGCAAEFAAWRSMQSALGELGPAQAPVELQARLRDALATEIVTGRHLSPQRRFAAFWQRTLVPTGLRLGAGLAAALVILGSGSWLLGTALPVQANDDRMAHLNAPQFLYSARTPEAISPAGDPMAVVVDAKVDAQGRVYDFDILEGPMDAATRVRVEGNLLQSVFKPATVFGEPVPGHVVMTFLSISARG